MKNLFFYGQSGSGKDTLANYFREKHHYLKFRCAGTIKQVLSEKNGLTASMLEIEKRRNEKLRKAHWKFGDEYNGKRHASVMQRLQNILSRDSIEFDIMPDFLQHYPLIISDTRLEIEIDYLLKAGFIGIFLTRKTGEFQDGKHSTENDLIENGTVARLSKRYPNQCLIVCNDIVTFPDENQQIEYTKNLAENLSKRYPDALNVLIQLNPTGEQLVNSFNQNLIQIIPNLMDNDVDVTNEHSSDDTELLYKSR